MILSPKDKAGELFYSFYRIERRGNTIDAKIIAKQCALVAVDDILKVAKELADEETLTPVIIYWLKVKQEIEKL